MHWRNVKYTGALFRAYVTEEKLMQTLHPAEQQGFNTVFETGAQYVDRYHREFRWLGCRGWIVIAVERFHIKIARHLRFPCRSRLTLATPCGH